ncbi:MAG: hypothetical protein ABSF22_22655 [Bryobacteraceae bacterium]|jgi:uncharacterized protein (UPF0332 family)
MGIAEELLALAGHLATSHSPTFEQAAFRRSVSTAYYALFHLLVGEAAQRWNGSAEAQLGLERAFKHNNMKEVSVAVSKGSWKTWSAEQKSVPRELLNVADAFIDLQEARHLADYDNTKIWTFTEADAPLTQARTAFENWRTVQTNPAPHEFLLALLIGKKRE